MVVPVTCFDPEIFFDNDVYFVKNDQSSAFMILSKK